MFSGRRKLPRSGNARWQINALTMISRTLSLNEVGPPLILDQSRQPKSPKQVVQRPSDRRKRSHMLSGADGRFNPKLLLHHLRIYGDTRHSAHPEQDPKI